MHYSYMTLNTLLCRGFKCFAGDDLQIYKCKGLFIY